MKSSQEYLLEALRPENCLAVDFIHHRHTMNKQREKANNIVSVSRLLLLATCSKMTAQRQAKIAFMDLSQDIQLKHL